MEGIPDADMKEHEQQRNKSGGNKKYDRDSESSEDESSAPKKQRITETPTSQPVMTMPQQPVQMMGMGIPNVRSDSIYILLFINRFLLRLVAYFPLTFSCFLDGSSGANGSSSTKNAGNASNDARDDARCWRPRNATERFPTQSVYSADGCATRTQCNCHANGTRNECACCEHGNPWHYTGNESRFYRDAVWTRISTITASTATASSH